MVRTRGTIDAADLLVQGTYALRRGLARVAPRPVTRSEQAGERAGRDGGRSGSPRAMAVGREARASDC